MPYHRLFPILVCCTLKLSFKSYLRLGACGCEGIPEYITMWSRFWQYQLRQFLIQTSTVVIEELNPYFLWISPFITHRSALQERDKILTGTINCVPGTKTPALRLVNGIWKSWCHAVCHAVQFFSRSFLEALVTNTHVIKRHLTKSVQ